MKIDRILIKNIKSFKNETIINFRDDLNIFIGPNASGKSNLMDIISGTLEKYFLWSYVIDRNSGGSLNKSEQIDRINLEKNISCPNSDSTIETTFKVTENDIDNFIKIIENIDRFKSLKRNFNWSKGTLDIAYKKLTECTEFKLGEEFTYSITNLQIQENDIKDGRKTYLWFLRYFNAFIILQYENNLHILNPLRLNIVSNRQFDDLNSITLANQDLYNDQAVAYSRDSHFKSNVFHYAELLFCDKRRSCEVANAESYNGSFNEDPDFINANKQLKWFGYSFTVDLVNKNNNEYKFTLIKKEKELTFKQLSSGEKEIFCLVLTVFGLGIQYGIIQIDEPELHLHPQWQKMFFELIDNLSKERNIQFIVSTHSQSFINATNISSIQRLTKIDDSTKSFSLKEIGFNDKDFLHICKSSNNEKMFFVNHVICVEGISDKLVFEKILDEQLNETDIRSSLREDIEIIDIDGKYNGKRYKTFMEPLGINVYQIYDLDYLKKSENPEVKKFLKCNTKKAKEDMKNPNNRDGSNICKTISNCLDKNNIDELKKEWKTFIESKKKFDPNCVNKPEVIRELKKLANNNIYVLKKGSLENYLPQGYKKKDINKLISLIKSEEFKKWSEEYPEKYNELKSIVDTIINSVRITTKVDDK